jgi:hypothetical protein
MISRAIVQSAIVLMNRRMNAERGVITFVPVCSSVAGMLLHHLEGGRPMQERSVDVLSNPEAPGDFMEGGGGNEVCDLGDHLRRFFLEGMHLFIRRCLVAPIRLQYAQERAVELEKFSLQSRPTP